jgi:hypothetical protein
MTRFASDNHFIRVSLLIDSEMFGRLNFLSVDFT